MIWDNSSIFRTNCAIACGTRACMLWGFLHMSRGENDVRMNHRNVWYFWPTYNSPQLNTFMYVRILLLQLKWSSTVLNSVMSCFIYLRPSYVPLLLLQEVRITSLQVSHMLKNNSFSLTQQKHYNWIYLDITAFQDFKVSLLLPHACEEFAR